MYLTKADLRLLEQKAAGLPVEKADMLIDKAFTAAGVAWLRRTGWLSPAVDRDVLPVDTGDQRQRRAS
jgi:hypothetical protein